MVRLSALVAVLAVPASIALSRSAAFVPRHGRSFGAVVAGRRGGDAAPGVCMYSTPSGKDCFAEIKKDAKGATKVFTSLPPTVASGLINTMIPAAGVIGGAAGVLVAPAAVPVGVIGGLGGYIASIASAAGRRKLVLQREEAAIVHLAGLLEQDFTTVTPAQVSAVQDMYSVPDEQFEEMLIDIYKRFILAMLKDPEFKTSELKELEALQKTLGLTAEQLSDAFYETVESVFRTSVMWTSTKDLEDAESVERMTVDKCIYLASRVLSQIDTDEGYEYTMSRCRKLLSLEQKEFEDRCLNLASPLYSKALSVVPERLESLTADSLTKARVSLGISDNEVRELHQKTFVDEAKRVIMSSSTPSLDSAGVDRLNKLREVLNIGEEDARFMTNEVVVPLYCDAIDEVLETIDEDPKSLDAAVRSLVSRQEELSMSPDAAGSVILSLVQDMVNEPFEEAIRFVRLDNSKGAVARLKDMVYSKETAELLLEKLVDAAALSPDSPACTALEGGLDLSNVEPDDLTSAYRLFLADSLAEGSDAYDQDSVEVMGGLLNMTPEKTVAVYDEVCGPMLRARLAEGIASDNVGAEAKAENAAFVAKLQIPAQVLDEVTAELYKNKLAAASGGGKIMTAEEREMLDKMRDFLDLPLEKCQGMHRKACAGAYTTAVLEAMGAGGSGVINQDYYSGLDKLADRLLLGPADQDALFNDAVKVRMEPMVTELLSQFERSVLNKQQLAQKTGKDQGEDLFVQGGGSLGLESGANMMLEVVNMVDFYQGNNLWSAKGEGDDVSYEYRVTAKGMAEDKMLEEVYRQFTVSSFQARGSPAQQKRYELAQTHFGGILGITPEREEEVKEDIGKVVYSQYVNQLLSTKGKIEQQDMQFLVNIQQVLKMDDEYCFELLNKLQKAFLREQVDKLFKADKLTGELAKSVRVKADSMGVDVRDDLKLEMSVKSDCFLAEVGGAIESGEVTVDNKGVIEDIQDAWGIPNEVATKDFTRLVESKVIAAVKSASADVNNQNERGAVRYLDSMLGYAAFIPEAVEQDKNVDKRMKEKLLATYTASKAAFDGETDPAVTARIELLGQVLGL